MSDTQKKLFPLNYHQNHYENWHYLGNDGTADYYVLPWELVGKDGRFTLGDVPWLSIVYSNAPEDYASPQYDYLLNHPTYREHPQYQTLYDLLIANGYHATGRTVN